MWQYGEEVPSGQGTPPSLVVEPRLGAKDPTRRFAVVPGLNPLRRIVVHNNSLGNLIRAVTERVLLVKDGRGGLIPCPKPKPGVIMDTLSMFRTRLRRFLPTTAPIELGSFWKQYEGRKAAIYKAAEESLLVFPIERKDAQVSWFVKYEKVDATGKADPIPRVISPRSARYNVMIGRFLKHTEHILFHGIDRVWGEKVIAKGLNASETGALISRKWKSFKKPVAVCVDASRFDQHVSKAMMEEFEHRVYNSWYRDKEFARLISWQLVNDCRGYTDSGVVKARVEGVRMSGDMNTSAGNCLIMCAMAWAYCASRELRARFINNGDDCVFFVEEEDLPRLLDGFSEWFVNLGFEMTVEPPVYELEKIEFCQTHPVEVANHEYIMVRNLHSVLAKDSTCLANVDHPESVTAWLAAVGQGGTAAYGGIPILDAFYQMCSRSGKVKKQWAKSYARNGMYYLSKGMNRRGYPILDVTRLSYFVAFGVLPHEQVQLEKHFDGLSVDRGLPIYPSEVFPEPHPFPFSDLVSDAVNTQLTC